MRYYCGLLTVGLFIAFLQFLIACDTGPHNTSKITDPNAGNMQVRLIWPDHSATGSKYSPAAINCSALGVSTISVEILTATGRSLANGGPYPCLREKAVLNKVEAGQDRIVVVLAKDAAGYTLYRGETPNVNIQAEVKTSVEVVVNRFVPDLTFPIEGEPVSIGCSSSFDWSSVASASSYRLFVAETNTFTGGSVKSLETQDAGVATSSAALNLLDNSLYYWRVHALDSKGNISAPSDTAEFVVKNVSQVTNFYSGGSSYPHDLRAYGDKLFFIARMPATNFSFELFVTDGHNSGTRVVKQIHQNELPSNLTEIPKPRDLVELGEWLYFCADDGINGSRIWRTDGTEANTSILVFPQGNAYFNPAQLTVFGDAIFFVAESDGLGRELWLTDGTAEGTRLLSDVWQGEASSNPLELTAAGDWLYFAADDGIHGYELWRTNGSMISLFDIHTIVENERELGSYPRDLMAVGGQLIFGAYDRVHLREMWMMNGEMSEPVMVPEVSPGGSSMPLFVTHIGGTRVAFTAFNSTNRSSGYIYDWQAFSDPPRLIPGNITDYKSPANYVAMGEKLFFTATDLNEIEQLWTYDLTNLDNPPVALSQSINIKSCRSLTVLNDRLYFSAFHPDFGTELWTTDGTVDGTHMVADIFANTSSSAPVHLTVFNNKLFFAAYNGEGGEELFQYCP